MDAILDHNLFVADDPTRWLPSVEELEEDEPEPGEDAELKAALEHAEETIKRRLRALQDLSEDFDGVYQGLKDLPGIGKRADAYAYAANILEGLALIFRELTPAQLNEGGGLHGVEVVLRLTSSYGAALDELGKSKPRRLPYAA